MQPDSARIRRRICIVTPGYISATPRVVREADALSAANFDVRVVCTQGHLTDVRAFDRAVLAGRAWQAAIFRWSKDERDERWAFYRTGLRQRAVRAVARAASGVGGLTERAEGRAFPELAKLAARQPADLYIGHYPTGLAAARWAADRHGAEVGYDVEDLYADTFADSAHWAASRSRILTIEQRHVSGCCYISAVSAPVADVFRARYLVARPAVVHNAHPWSDRAGLDGAVKERQGPALSLFWYSQTVGLDRGLQDAIRAMGRAGVPLQLHLRGFVDPAVKAEFTRLALECGIPNALHFHPACAPSELLSRAVEHDVGLALEMGDSLNRKLTVTNKLLLYLVAGLAVVASDLPGQRSVMTTCPDAGVLWRPGDIEAMAQQLRLWSASRGALRAAKDAALAAGRDRWNWEHEAAGLVAVVSAKLGGERARAGAE